MEDQVVHERIAKQKPGHCCVLVYTSGTTGQPKGVMLSHDNLSWGALNMYEIGKQEEPERDASQNRMVSYLPLSHVASLSVDIITHMIHVSQLYFARPDALQGTIM